MTQTTIFRCPVCQQALTKTERTYQCDNGHAFDRAREGYVNLLLANQKNSKDPGDSREMIRSRKAFLDAGYYAPLAQSLAGTIADIELDKLCILDAGCGEGYYTDYIQQHATHELTLYGIDISKEAVRYAAKRNKTIGYAVASIAQLPVQDNSVDVVLSVFSPRDTPEIGRVLTNNGILITATPASQHLVELRQLIYDTIRPFDPLPPDSFAPEFQQQSSQQLVYDIQLESAQDILHLLQMTPFYWHMPADKQAHLRSLPSLDLTVAFEISVWRKAST